MFWGWLGVAHSDGHGHTWGFCGGVGSGVQKTCLGELSGLWSGFVLSVDAGRSPLGVAVAFIRQPAFGRAAGICWKLRFGAIVRSALGRGVSTAVGRPVFCWAIVVFGKCGVSGLVKGFWCQRSSCKGVGEAITRLHSITLNAYIPKLESKVSSSKKSYPETSKA